MSDDLSQRLQALTDAQAGEVLRALLAQLDESPPAVSEEELAARESEDREYLEAGAAGLEIDDGPTSGSVSARSVLLAFYENVPDLEPQIANALESAALDDETLIIDLGASALLSLLVISVSAGIMRPRVRVEKEVEGDRSRTRVDVEVRGIKNIGKVVKAILPFI